MDLFTIDPNSETSLFRQLYDEIRKAILDRRLAAGSRLPSSRQLAEELNVSRNTVINAYEQLLAEGYINGHTGSGTYVANVQDVPEKSKPVQRKNALSARGKAMAGVLVTRPSLAGAKISFRPGNPALENFPFSLWGKFLIQTLRNLRARDFHYGDPAGYPPLREAVAQYLNRGRGVRCTPEQVVIVNGSQQSLDLCCRVLLDPGDIVWMEDPGYRGANAAFQGSGVRVVPVPLDAEGLQWVGARGARPRLTNPRCIYITPSHQFPMAITMSLQRRLSLLKFAKENNAWILEDDYDSEFRYDGRPLAALQGLDENDCVVYMGTFSKVLFAGLRLGYVVVPQDLIQPFVNTKSIVDRHSPILEQATVAEFIRSGRFERHIRNMRKLYATRQKKLVDSVNYFLKGRLEVEPRPAGMHLIGWLREGIDDQAVSQRAASNGIEVPAISSYTQKRLPRGGLLLGYSAIPASRIPHAVEALSRVM